VRRKVEVALAAEFELQQAFEWIRVDSPDRAVAWREEAVRAMQSLAVMSFRGAIAPEAEFFGREIRQLLFGRYRILYSVEGDTVYILHFIHGARRPLRTEDE
jgi:plasmid stabilization system protein ParE